MGERRGLAGDGPSVVLAKARAISASSHKPGGYGDMVAMGVLDPTRVIRYALQNADSVTGLMLTTDTMVAELRRTRSKAACPAVDCAAWEIWRSDVPPFPSERAGDRVSSPGRLKKPRVGGVPCLESCSEIAAI